MRLMAVEIAFGIEFLNCEITCGFTLDEKRQVW